MPAQPSANGMLWSRVAGAKDIATSYSSHRKTSPNPEGVRVEQMAWLKKRNGCKTTGELLATMQQRNAELSTK